MLREVCFSTTVGLVRPKTRDKRLNVNHDAGSMLIHAVIVSFDCYHTSHCKNGSLASITNLHEYPCVVQVTSLFC